jgi:hypothetical protein
MKTWFVVLSTGFVVKVAADRCGLDPTGVLLFTCAPRVEGSDKNKPDIQAAFSPGQYTYVISQENVTERIRRQEELLAAPDAGQV